MPKSNRRIRFTPKHLSSLRAAYEKIDTHTLSPACLICRLTTPILHLPTTGNVHPFHKSAASVAEWRILRGRRELPPRSRNLHINDLLFCGREDRLQEGKEADFNDPLHDNININGGEKKARKNKNGATNAAPRPLLVTRTQLTPLTRRSDAFNSIKTQLRLHIYTEKMITTSLA